MVPLVELGEQDGVEVDRPDPVVGLLETDVGGQSVGEEEQAVLEPLPAAPDLAA